MEIGEFCLVLQAEDFARTCRFYGEILALPRVRSYEGEQGRSATFRAGSTLIEIRDRGTSPSRRRRRAAPADGPALELLVPSAELVYEQMVFRHRNIPGGLSFAADGSKVFVTHDPDGVQIVFHEKR